MTTSVLLKDERPATAILVTSPSNPVSFGKPGPQDDYTPYLALPRNPSYRRPPEVVRDCFSGGQVSQHAGAGDSLGKYAHVFVLNVVRYSEVSQCTSRATSKAVSERRCKARRKEPARGVSRHRRSSETRFRPPTDNGSGRTSITKGLQRVIHRFIHNAVRGVFCQAVSAKGRTAKKGKQIIHPSCGRRHEIEI